MTDETTQDTEATEDKPIVDYETQGELPLTEDEIRLIESEGAEPDEIEEEEQAEDEGEEEVEEPDEEEAEDEGDDSGDAEDDGADEPDDEPEEKEEPFVPKYGKDEDKDRDFAAELAGIAKRYEDGEIELSEMLDERDKVISAREALKNDEIVAAQVKEREEQDREKQWKTAVDTFAAAEVNARFITNPVLKADLEVAMSGIAQTPEAIGKSFGWLLEKARDAVAEARNIDLTPPKQEDPKPKTDPPKRRADLSKVPKNVADAPASDSDMEGGSRFDKLDNLSVDQREAAIARLSPDELDKYLESAPGSGLTKDDIRQALR